MFSVEYAFKMEIPIKEELDNASICILLFLISGILFIIWIPVLEHALFCWVLMNILLFVIWLVLLHPVIYILEEYAVVRFPAVWVRIQLSTTTNQKKKNSINTICPILYKENNGFKELHIGNQGNIFINPENESILEIKEQSDFIKKEIKEKIHNGKASRTNDK